MATTVSSKKRIRQNKTHNLRNKAKKSAAKTQTKKVLAALKEGDAAKAEEELKVAYKLIDKCGKHNAYHPNKAAHMKSSLARKVKALKST
jgi:small subunit ribosomal protein S20